MVKTNFNYPELEHPKMFHLDLELIKKAGTFSVIKDFYYFGLIETKILVTAKIQNQNIKRYIKKQHDVQLILRPKISSELEAC